MLDADPEFPDAHRDRICACYCVLAKTADETRYTAPFSGAEVPEAEAKAKDLVDGIERGVFWPPAEVSADRAEWKWDFDEWIFNTPGDGVDPAWLADQRCRLKRLQPSL